MTNATSDVLFHISFVSIFRKMNPAMRYNMKHNNGLIKYNVSNHLQYFSTYNFLQWYTQLKHVSHRKRAKHRIVKYISIFLLPWCLRSIIFSWLISTHYLFFRVTSYRYMLHIDHLFIYNNITSDVYINPCYPWKKRDKSINEHRKFSL